jgi:hypothetical protein
MDALYRLIEIGFSRIGKWKSTLEGPIFVPEGEMSEGNVLSAFVSDRRVLYVGKTMRPLAKRMCEYERPGPSQRTNKKCNENICEHLAKNKPVEVLARPQNRSYSIGSFTVSEAAGLEDAIIRDMDPPWNRLGRRAGARRNRIKERRVFGGEEEKLESMRSFNSVKRVSVVWADDGSSYVYEAVPNSVIGNQNSASIRFELREVDGQDENLEVVVQQKNDGSYVFKTDYYENPEREYPLKLFVADDELLFYFNGKEGVAYFHLAV